MPPKNKIPAPIDKPLSRAYLREFTGWSSAYPPGISDPTSLRIMENVMVNRDGSARIRPGLRHISYRNDGEGNLVALDREMVGTHETFFLNDGSKAYLFAVREDDGTVGFRVLGQGPLGQQMLTLTDCEFAVPQGTAVLNFRSDCTYVKYLQIDNKIFALSDNDETMRLFYVGANKSARALSSIERPNFDVNDKLTVVHPDAAWTNAAVPSGLRTNYMKSPRMDAITAWVPSSVTEFARVTTVAHEGIYSGRIGSKETRRNLCHYPLGALPGSGFGGWFEGNDHVVFSNSGGFLRVQVPAADSEPGINYRAGSPVMSGFTPGVDYQISVTIGERENVRGEGNVRFVWYTSANAQVGDVIVTPINILDGRRNTTGIRCPSGASRLRVYIVGEAVDGGFTSFGIKDVLVNPNSETTTYFDGSSGANYFWEGAVNSSQSIYHPPQNVEVYTYCEPIVPGQVGSSIQTRAGSIVKSVTAHLEWRNGTTTVGAAASAAENDAVGSWNTHEVNGVAPPGTTRIRYRVTIPSVARGEYHYIDSAILEQAAAAGAFFHGGSADSGTLDHRWTGTTDNSNSTVATYAAANSIPAAETRTAATLISSAAASNVYNFGFFYTFANEIGESAPSQVTVVRAMRSWQSWRWETPSATGEPSGTATADPGRSADQLVAIMPQAVFDTAIDQGATHWNLYAFTWSDQDPVPVMAVQIGRRELQPGALYTSFGWNRMTPQMSDAGAESAPIPQASTRFNYSNPSRGAQGIVASDRMVLVNDPTAGAVIRWTSNQIGSYTDFSASKGGGYKTLTSGELMVAACVKLWQNPQSVDTLTILCLGVDGYSTGYYMAPAQVASQSEATNIMGFEETTATPGTTSPYGVEVMNNALYHPIDEMLMKSTANNYNISHKSMTDQIQNMWKALDDKHLIVSSQLDNRLYYLVNNPSGAEMEPGCRGNEVWVFDAAAEQGTWSRWLVPGHSLRKIEQGGQVVMSLMHPSGIFYFDETYNFDDVIDPDNGTIDQRNISWRLETNTQGANRAHDAWCRLQQVNVTFGNFLGRCRYGIRGWNIHGKPVDIGKDFGSAGEPGIEQWDEDTYLLTREDLREWFFYAESVVDPDTDLTVHSVGQINLVQYRYTPATVNTGYEYGSVETFEYGRSASLLEGVEQLTNNGVPMPYIDTRRP